MACHRRTLLPRVPLPIRAPPPVAPTSPRGPATRARARPAGPRPAWKARAIRADRKLGSTAWAGLEAAGFGWGSRLSIGGRSGSGSRGFTHGNGCHRSVGLRFELPFFGLGLGSAPSNQHEMRRPLDEIEVEATIGLDGCVFREIHELLRPAHADAIDRDRLAVGRAQRGVLPLGPREGPGNLL